MSNRTSDVITKHQYTEVRNGVYLIKLLTKNVFMMFYSF